jgi:hypothetical protein
LRNYNSSLSREQLRHPIKKKLDVIIHRLENHNFSDLQIYWNAILEEKGFGNLIQLLNSYSNVLELESNSGNLLLKIRHVKKNEPSNPIKTVFIRS